MTSWTMIHGLSEFSVEDRAAVKTVRVRGIDAPARPGEERSQLTAIDDYSQNQWRIGEAPDECRSAKGLLNRPGAGGQRSERLRPVRPAM